MSAQARAGTVSAPIAEVVTAFREYTIDVRGLSFWTAQTRGDVARRFLVSHAPGGAGDLAAVTVEHVHEFFRTEAQRLATMSMGPVLDSMRASCGSCSLPSCTTPTCLGACPRSPLSVIRGCLGM